VASYIEVWSPSLSLMAYIRKLSFSSGAITSFYSSNKH